MVQLKFLVAIHQALNLSFLRYQKLKNFFGGDFCTAFQAPIKDWQAAEIDPKGIETFFVNRAKGNPEKLWETIEKLKIRVLEYGNDLFPKSLHNIASPPAILFVRGNPELLNQPAFTVVGSRKITAYGKRVISEMLPPIIQNGIVIVSGLAFGVDALAHECALLHQGKTIAVLGNGIDKIYPVSNLPLAKKILGTPNGAIISEFCPGVEARPEFFPQRNRIVAGLGKGTLVVEAAEKSGSLITAGFARDSGRDVFAVPGEIFSPHSKGTNQLIADGANPALDGKLILETLGFHEEMVFSHIRKNLPELSEIEKQILQFFKENGKMHLDEVIRHGKFSAVEIFSQISLLELKGLVKNLGNQVYNASN